MLSFQVASAGAMQLTPESQQAASFPVTIGANGPGHVELSPPGGLYSSGTVVIAAAVPDSGYRFVDWDGDLDGNVNPDTLIVDSSKTVTATFRELPRFNLSLTTTGPGTVRLSPVGGIYYRGTVVTVTAEPAPGAVLSDWRGALSGYARVQQVTVDRDKQVSAVFLTPPQPRFATGILTSGPELATLPTSGVSWANLEAQANASAGVPNLADQTDSVNVRVLAKALVYARTGIESYRTQVIDACMAAIGTENGGSALALGRELAAYVLAADLVGIPAAEDTTFRAWLRQVLTKSLGGRSLVSTHEDRPNNWGTQCGSSRLAVAAYLDDRHELARAAAVFHGYVGDVTAYNDFKYGDLDWQANATQPKGINSVGTILNGENVDGVLPDDQRRAGGFAWPPPHENYVYEGLQGALLQAIILWRAGYDVWNWEDQALLRAFKWLYEIADFPAEDDDIWLPYIINHYYAQSFRTPLPSRPGKNAGWTDWLYGGRYGIESVASTDGDISLATRGINPEGQASVEATALPDSAYAFDGWGGNLSGFNNPETIALDGHKLVSAAFVKEFQLAIRTVGGGTVIADPATPGSKYIDRTVVTLTAVPDSGFVFSEWSGDVFGSNNPLSTFMDRNKSAIATFTQIGGDGSEIFTFRPSDDAQVKSSRPEQNYGNEPSFKVDVDDIFHSLLKFQVTGLKGQVESATLRLFVLNSSDDGGTIRPVGDNLNGTATPWTEQTVTWNNAPVATSLGLDSLGRVNQLTVVELNLTNGITGNGVYSFVLTNRSGDKAEYSSKEGLRPPELTVVTRQSQNNQPPQLNDDLASTNEDVSVNIVVLANDQDVDGSLDPSTLRVLRAPTNGATVPDPSAGAILYTPASNFFGADSFTYTVSDDDGVLGTEATVTINVLHTNDPPVAFDDASSTQEDTPITISPLANDSDPEGQLAPSSLAVVGLPRNGGTTVNTESGTITYTPTQDFFGADTISYTVSDQDGAVSNHAIVVVTVTPVNDPPLAGDDTVSIAEDTPATIDVLANDQDIDGSLDVSSVAIVSAPSHGAVHPDSEGRLRYVPAANFSGSDSLTYRVSDDSGDASNEALVRISILETTDPPIARNDTVSTPEDVGVTISVLANDEDPDGSLDPQTTTILRPAAHGSASVSSALGQVRYAPSPDFFGTDSFSYQVSDNVGAVSNEAFVFVNVISVNDAPVAHKDTLRTTEDTPADFFLGNGVDIDGTLDLGSISILDSTDNGTVNLQGAGFVRYTPTLNFSGGDSLVFDIADNEGLRSNAATLYIVVSAGGDAPVAMPDTATTDEDTDILISVVDNDTDSDGQLGIQSMELLRQPGHGTAALTLTQGVIRYVPLTNFFGFDTLSYRIKDLDGLFSNEAQVFVTVSAVNDAPLAVPDSVTTPEDLAAVIDILSNDQDVDDALRLERVDIVAQPTHGMVAADTLLGLLTYTPTLDYAGRDSFAYVIRDGHGATSNIAGVRVNVTPVNDLPVAENDTVTVGSNSETEIMVTANDFDVEGLNLASLTVVDLPLNGSTVAGSSAGGIRYSPNANFTGIDRFRYTIADSDGALSGKATVILVVTAGNAAPVANHDAATMSEDQVISVNVLANDSDADGALQPASVQVVRQPAHGSTQVASTDGSIAYTPIRDFFGIDTLAYTVGDNSGMVSNPALVVFTIAPVNDAPVARKDTAETSVDSAITIEVSSNDSDLDGSIDLASLAITSAPAHGAVLVIPNSGAILYTPGSGFSGLDSLSYTIADNDGMVSNVAVVTIAIRSGQTSRYISFVPTNDGQVKLTEIDKNYGTKNTSKIENFKFKSYYKFEISGLTGSVASATLRLTVPDGASDGGDSGGVLHKAENTVPGAGVPWTESILTGRNAPEIVGNIIDQIGVVAPNQTVDLDVTAAVSGNGTVSFCLSSASGNMVRYFTKEGEVPPELLIEFGTGGGEANLSPVAADDQGSTVAGVPVVIDVLANDSDSDGSLQRETVSLLSQPAHGSAQADGVTGALTYVPATNFVGIDSLTYAVHDDDGAQSNPGLVTIIVSAAGDNAPVAVNDSAMTTKDTPIVIEVLANDQDQDGNLAPATIAIIANALNGTTIAANGAVTYSPNPAFTGNDRFRYTVEDNTGLVSNIATVAIQVSDATPGQTLAFQPTDDGQVKLTEIDKNYGSKTTSKIGANRFRSYYKFAVSGLAASIRKATLQLTVSNATSDGGDRGGDLYQASNHIASTTTSWTESILTGRNAPETLGSVLGSQGPVSPGQLVEFDVTQAVTGNGVFSFCLTPASGNQVRYDTREGTVPPVLVIETGSGPFENRPPVAVRDLAGTTAGTQVEIAVMSNDSDPDGAGDLAAVTIISGPLHGTATVSSNQTIAYAPTSGFSGMDSLRYSVEDQSGAASSPATVTITVLPKAGETAILTFQPTDDAQIRLSRPTNNYGLSRTTKVELDKYQTYLKFNVSGVNGVISRAVLRLTVGTGTSDGSDDGGSLYEASNNLSGLSEPWTEFILTAENAPTLISGELAAAGRVELGEVVEFPLTGIITGNSVRSFCLKSGSGNLVRYKTKETLAPPELILEVVPAGSQSESTLLAFNDNATGAALLPKAFGLKRAYPNPFNPETTIEYALPRSAQITLQIYNVRGQLVRTLVDTRQEAGFKKLRWSGLSDGGSPVSSGIYFVRMQAANNRFTQRIVLQK